MGNQKKNRYNPKYRVYEYAQQCVMRGQKISESLAESRGLVEFDGRGIKRVSDDLICLGKRTQRGWERLGINV